MLIKSKKGFTLIEVITTLIIIAVAFLPLMRMYTAALEQVEHAGNLMIGSYLAKMYMEKVRNIAVTKERLLATGNTIEPGIGSPPLELNSRYWRIAKEVRSMASGPVEVTVKLYVVRKDLPYMDRSFLKEEPLLEISTLVEDIEVVE